MGDSSPKLGTSNRLERVSSKWLICSKLLPGSMLVSASSRQLVWSQLLELILSESRLCSLVWNDSKWPLLLSWAGRGLVNRLSFRGFLKLFWVVCLLILGRFPGKMKASLSEETRYNISKLVYLKIRKYISKWIASQGVDEAWDEGEVRGNRRRGGSGKWEWYVKWEKIVLLPF